MPLVVIVEDNDMNRDMLSRRLVRRGYEVLLASDGEQGVALARRSRPQLILLDMSLPVMDGWTAARLLKSDQATREIPVIALTAHALPADRQKALDAGCDEYETKPVDLNRLLEKMETLLSCRPAAEEKS
jgi:CheY-like chemotaxis protein